MADFGFDWDNGTEENEHIDSNTAETSSTVVAGVVVHRVAASDRQANMNGTTENELIEPMIEDKAKALEVKTLENKEENLSALEIFCQRSMSVYIFQRVWAAKEVGRLLSSEQREIAMGVLVPIGMRLAEDNELFVRETMAQDLLPLLHYYFKNKQYVEEINAAACASRNSSNDKADSRPSSVSSEASSSASKTETEETAANRVVVPQVQAPASEDFDAWLHRVLLAPHPSVSLPAQRATVALGKQLGFDVYHTEIVHGVILGLVRNPVHEQLLNQQKRSKEMVIKSRDSGSPPRPATRDDTSSRSSSSSSSSLLSSGLATLFGRKSWQSDSAESRNSDDLDVDALVSEGNSESQASQGAVPAGFFLSPADEAARLEQTRRKLLMLHMIHLVAAEFGAEMRPAVFVPVVERAAKDRTFEVRRDAAAVLGSLAKAVSNDLAMDVLFASFLQLTQDAVWQVRQSAARHALPGLALVLATRNSRPPSTSSHVADYERKHSLQQFASSAAAAAAAGGLAAEGLRLSTDPEDADPLSAFMYRNQPARSVPDKQWLQLVERLTGPREPSPHVRAAVFESVGKLALALVDCPRTRDALVSLVVSDVQRAHSDNQGRFGLFGSSTSLQSLDDDDDEDLDEAGSSAGTVRRNGSNGGGTPANRSGPPKVRAQRAVGRDVLYHSAFNFPALLAALGAQGWDRLRDVYMQLSKTEQYEARQTLACSLHEVARILASNTACTLAASARLASNRVSAGATSGSANTISPHSADLESVLCLFLIDGAEIKMGALRHLGDTLTWLTPASRVRCLPMIMQVFKHDGQQWRTRELMAAQLVKLCHLFPASIVVGSLLPQAVSWAHDPVAGVRAAVAPAFPIVFELTKLDPSTQVRFFETVISFSHAASFRGRLFFIEICSALLAHDQDPDSDPVDFDQFFLPSLAALAADRVANVRIALARLVRRMLENRMRRQSISATLADMWVPPTLPQPASGSDSAAPASETENGWVDMPENAAKRQSTAAARRKSSASGASRRGQSRRRSNTRDSIASNASSTRSSDIDKKHKGHRSLGSITRRARRNTTPMRAHLLATMVQQLAKDSDRDVLDLVRDLPGLPLTTAAIIPTVPEHSISSEQQQAAASKPSSIAEPDVELTAKSDEEMSCMIKAFPHPPPSPPLAPTKAEVSDKVDSTVDAAADNDQDALDELLSSYERDDDQVPSSVSAISQPLSHNS
ncbi:hypothetical protein IWW40_003762 [Coemansia sp. RSA 1250]|nr:hypothetical protein IWW40_003762 [Coemansia sp. RSA 1250]